MDPKYSSTGTATFAAPRQTIGGAAASHTKDLGHRACHLRSAAVALLVTCVLTVLVGCGGGGYPGGGITSTSSAAITIDASQSITVTAAASGGTISWALGNCSGACGTLSATTGNKVTYIAPAVLTSPMKVALVASLAGTKSTETTSITVNPEPIITADVPNGVIGTNYSAWIKASGGTAPLKVSMNASGLPAGLNFDATTGMITGVPTATGTWTITAQIVDASDVTYAMTWNQGVVISGSKGSQITVNGAIPTGVVNTLYTTAFTADGGTAPYTYSLAFGSLPAGLTLSSAGTVSGTPTAAGTSIFVVQAQDATGAKGTNSFTLTVAPTPLKLTLAGLPNGTVGAAYQAVVGVSGGTAPYTCSIVSGALPTGLSFGAGCAVAGVPTVAGTSNLTVKVTDAASQAQNITGPLSVTIKPAPLALSANKLENGTVGVSYSSAISFTGGVAPYTCSLTSGALPSGLSLGAGCAVGGTPSVAGIFPLGIHASDAATPASTVDGQVSLTISPAPLVLTTGTLPAGVVGSTYSAPITVTGGTAPYSCAIVSGTLPAGLSLGAGCLVSGTPSTAGSESLIVRATDSSNPVLSATDTVSLTIAPLPLALAVNSLADGVLGTLYNEKIGVSGGAAPYTCSLASGALPLGLLLSANCSVTGVPLAVGTSSFRVKVTDASGPTLTTTGSVSITIAPIALSLTTNLLIDGTVGVPYRAPLSLAGGTSPYMCLLVSGTLPAGLGLGANCVISGTPTEPGTVTISAKVSDSTNPLALSIDARVTLTIHAAPATLSVGTLLDGTVNVPYSGNLLVSGGTAPYGCVLASGSLPAGLVLGSDCSVTGTPTASGTANFSVKLMDSSSPQVSVNAQASLTINAARATLAISGTLPDATVNTAYAQTIGISGGIAPYSCTVSGGALPAGLTLGAACEVSGTPSTQGAASVTVKVTDSSNPVLTATGTLSILVDQLPALKLMGSLPNAVLNVAYRQTLHASGGLPPFAYSVTSGSLPAGLSMSSTGEISGTPTAPGASSFTVTVTDSEPTPAKASLPLLLLVTYAPTPQDTLLTGPYAFMFQGYDEAVAGVLAYRTATIGSFTADGAGVVSAGELDSNHQTSLSSGNMIASHTFLGTYTVGADDRGLLTTTTLHADGTVAATTTYAIALRASVAPASIAASGELTEFDSDQLEGTKGSGTLLAQTPADIQSGLNGSYAFGLQGDTPCLPTCTLGVIAGPAATVGQFATDGAGNITGTQDANVASVNLANSALAGTYNAADANGRVQLTLNPTGTPSGVYPTDYAVYVINANQAFILSTDKHSAYILLSGAAERQQLADFSNASFVGPYIGYENAQTNPGLLGATLQNIANLSTAIIFRGTGDGNGTCSTTNVDQGGVTALVNNLTGLGSGSDILNALLGTYQSTGNSICTMSANGRGVLAYPTPNTLLTTALQVLRLPTNAPSPRVVYMYGPNQGFFLETGYAGLGRLEQQTGSPFSSATLTGTYVYRTTPAATVASTTASGVFTADGVGHGTSELDLNVGVGTVNVLQLGVAGSFLYTLDDANTGRFVLGSPTVAYAISPTRFVVLDTNPLTTSPSVAVMYSPASPVVIQ